MSHNLTPGRYRVVSLVDGGAVGIDPTQPASQPVRVSGRIQDWNLKRDGETILLRIGSYPVTQVVNDRVIVSTLLGPGQKWRATYSELQEAYTIALDHEDEDDGPARGWTVLPDAPRSEIQIRPIIEIRTFPPRYLPTQLYRFEQIGE